MAGHASQHRRRKGTTTVRSAGLRRRRTTSTGSHSGPRHPVSLPPLTLTALRALMASPYGYFTKPTQQFLESHREYRTGFYAVLGRQRRSWHRNPYAEFPELFWLLESIIGLPTNSDGNLWWVAWFRAIRAVWGISTPALLERIRQTTTGLQFRGFEAKPTRKQPIITSRNYSDILETAEHTIDGRRREDLITLELSELPSRFISALRALGITASPSELVGGDKIPLVIETWNNALKLKGKARFVGVDTKTGFLIPPVPFTVIGWPVRIVVWGLNPHYTDTMLFEKEQALAHPGTWDSYARFHVGNGNTAEWPQILSWAIKSRYYYNLGTIAASLQSQQFHTLNEYYNRHGRSSDYRLQAFWGHTNRFGVMATEFLPFHSPKTALPTNIRDFLGSNHLQSLADQLDAYHKILLDTTMDILGPDGWIIALGQSVSQATQALLTAHGTLAINTCTNGTNVMKNVQTGTWTPKNSSSSYRVSFSPFMRTANGPLNKNVDIAAWLKQL